MRFAPLPLLLVACTPTPQALEVAAPAADPAFFFLVAMDAELAPTRLSPVWVSHGGQLAPGQRATFALEPTERAALMITLDRPVLRALHPGFDEARAAEVSAQLASPPTVPRVVGGAEPRVVAALPAGAALREVTAVLDASERARAEVALRAALTVSAPVDLDYCALAARPTLAPFAAAPKLFPRERPFPGEVTTGTSAPAGHDVHHLLMLSEDRALLVTPRAVAVVEQGAALTYTSDRPIDVSSPTWLLPLEAAVGAPVELSRAVLDRATAGAAEQTAWVVGRRDRQPALFELGVSARGVRWVSTTTAAPADGLLRGVAQGPAGELLLAGSGMLYRRADARSPLVSVAPDAPMLFDYRVALATGDAMAPFLVSVDDGTLVLGDPLRGQWSRYRRGDRLFARAYYDLAAAPDGELWAVGPNASVFRRRAGAWASVPVTLPPGAECAGAPVGDGPLTLTETVEAVAADATHAFVVVTPCTAIFALRRDDACAARVDVAEPRLGPLRWHAVARAGDRVVVSGDEGALFFARLASP